MTSTKTVTTDFHYDAKGNLDTVTPPPPLTKTTYTYDALGRTTTATDARGVTVTYTYDNRDRIKTVDTTNKARVEYSYDGDGNLTQRSDATGTIKYAFDPLQRETVRTLQDGSQTLLAYTAAGNVDHYSDPAGTTDYTWNEVNKLKELKDPQGRVTTYKYNNNDVRTTTYPGGTVQTVTADKSSRPEAIKTTSAQGTLVSLAYTYGYGTGGATDGNKIRTSTDDVSGLKRTYSYDGAGRFSYAKEEKSGSIADSWQYCYDLAGNHLPGHRPRLPPRHHLHLQRRPAAHQQVLHHRRLVLRRRRRRDRSRLHRRLHPHRREVDRPLTAVVDHRQRQDL
jgi:YD repeat-containing protein